MGLILFFFICLPVVAILIAGKTAAKNPAIRGQATKAAASFLIGKLLKR